MTAHWGVEAPAAFDGDDRERRAVVYRAFHVLDTRIKLLTSLRLEDVDALSLQKRLDDTGRTP